MKKVLSLILCMCMLITLFNANVITANAATGSDMVSFAQSVSGVYYTTGQSRLGPNTFDCSGFVYYVCSNVGISMSSGNTETQRTYGTDVDHSALKSSNNYSNLKAGDLIFMDWGGDGVSDHVGIYIGNGKMIHCWSSPGTPIATSNLSDWGTSTGKIYSYVCDIRRVASDAHTHSYTAGTHYEAVHPHREYSVCSCGDYQYTGNTVYVESCATCNPPVTVSKWVNCERVLWLPANVDIDLYNSPTDMVSSSYFSAKSEVWYYVSEKYALLSNGNIRYQVNTTNSGFVYIDESTPENLTINHTYDRNFYDVHPHSGYIDCECGYYEYVDNSDAKFSDCETCNSSFGENLYWNFDDGVLTISGTGDMPNWNRTEDTPWYDVLDEIRYVDIRDGVTNVGDYAFSYCENLKTVKFWDASDIIYIGESSFYGTPRDKNIYLHNFDIAKWCSNVAFEGNFEGAYVKECYGEFQAIFYYRAVTDITIDGSKVKNINDYAFSGWKSLKSVTITDGVKNIGKGAFKSCSNLESIEISESVTSIGAGAFSYCNLKSIVIPESVTKLETETFMFNTQLESITIPSSITSIGPRALSAYSTNVMLYITDLKSWCNIVDEYGSPFHNVYINNVLATNVEIPDGVTSIRDYCFRSWDCLESVAIPDSVTSIGDEAFAYCINLTSVTIPNSVMLIDYAAFDDCTALTDVYYLGTEAEWNSIKINGGNDYLLNATIHFIEDVSSVSLDKTSLSLTVGETETLTATVLPENSTNKNVTWTSSNTSIATVSNGVVTAKAAGTATITVTIEDGGYSATCVITVNEAIDENVPMVTIGSVTGRGGQTINVALDLKNNPGVAGMLLKLSYDSNLKLTNVASGSALSGLTFTAPGDLSANPVNLLWAGMDADFTSGTIAVLTFEIPDGLEEGTYEIKASYSAGDIYDDNLDDVDVNIVNGAINVRNVMLGDASGDGVINAKDITVLSRYIAGGYNVTVVEAAANVNGDSAINAKDITILSRYIAGGYGVELN